MRILAIGDIVGKPGRDTVVELLPELRENEKIDLVIANAENLTHGRGAIPEHVAEMQKAGVDYFTGGDHIFWQEVMEHEIDSLPVLRPANYPAGTPGQGYKLVDCSKNGQVLIINIMGRTSFGGTFAYLDDPFTKIDEILTNITEKYTFSIIDFHAEATSEKQALGFYVDGRIGAVLGTHTHVPTCDHQTLPLGTMFVTDIGMTGNVDSVLGVKKELIITQMLTARNQRFEWEDTGKKAFRSVIIDTDANSIERWDKYLT